MQSPASMRQVLLLLRRTTVLTNFMKAPQVFLEQ